MASTLIDEYIVVTAQQYLGKHSLGTKVIIDPKTGEKKTVHAYTKFNDPDFEEAMKDIEWRSGLQWCMAFAKLVWVTAHDLRAGQSRGKNDVNLTAALEKGDTDEIDKIDDTIKTAASVRNLLTLGTDTTWERCLREGYKISSVPVVGSIAIYGDWEAGIYTGGHAGIVVTVHSNDRYTEIAGNTSQNTGQVRNNIVGTHTKNVSSYGTPLMYTEGVGGKKSRKPGFKNDKIRYLRGFILPPDLEMGDRLWSDLDRIRTENEIYERVARTAQQRYYRITRDSTLIQDKKGIGDEEGFLIKFDSEFSYEDFMNYEDAYSGVTNRQMVERGQTARDKEPNPTTGEVELKFKRNMLICLPIDFMQRNNLDFYEPEKDILMHVDPIDIRDDLFMKTYDDLYNNDPHYNQRMNWSLTTKGKDIFVLEQTVQIWVYSKVYRNEHDGCLINLSGRLISCNSVSTLQGAFFEFTVGNLSLIRSVYGLYDNITDIAALLSNNDIVFIKYGRITADEAVEYSPIVNKSNIAGKYYDIIGLIDSVREVTSYINNDISISVTGRDLSKIFLDDAAKFFPLALTPELGAQMVAGQSTDRDTANGIAPFFSEFGKPKLLERHFGGTYFLRSLKEAQSIGNILQFYISLLSNIGLVSDEENDTFFDSYGDRRLKRTSAEAETQVLQSGIYQIIKLEIDKYVAERNIVDANADAPNGSIMQLLNNLCVQPFVELMMDTYGDMYKIIVRQPPFNKEGFMSWIDSVEPKKSVLRIPAERIVSKDLSFETTVYTWYQLSPQGLFWGSTGHMAMDYLSIVQLNEYVNIWGSKPMEITTNYLLLETVMDRDFLPSMGEAYEAGVKDLLFMIESTAYLPFSRRGSITLSYLDRGIKKGTFIYLESTREMFFVDAVTHQVSITNGSVEGYTVLQVSRGLVVDFISGVDKKFNGKTKKVSYFTIVDMKLVESVLMVRYDKSIQINKDTTYVDGDIFNFFLQREQFKHNIKNRISVNV